MNHSKLRMAERITICLDIVLIIALAISIFIAVCPGADNDAPIVAGCLFIAIGIVSAAAVYLNTLRSALLIGDNRRMKSLVIWTPIVYVAGVVFVILCSLSYEDYQDAPLLVLASASLIGYVFAGILTLVTSTCLADHIGKQSLKTETTNQSNTEKI